MGKAKSKARKKVIAKQKKDQRRNIRKIMKNADLSQFSKIAIEKEKARKKRFSERKKIVCFLDFYFLFVKMCF